MKIQLERNLGSGSSKLRCAVCEKIADRQPLRTLLCHDKGAILGDICTDCLHQTTNYIQQRLYQRAVRLIQQPRPQLSAQQEALELFELAHQPLFVPHFYVWWWQRLAILIAETRELESARIGSSRHPQPLKISFLTEEPPIANAGNNKL
jgi:hypothetical protein